MIKSFKSDTCSAKDFLSKVNQTLAERELGKIVNVSSSDDNVTITFNKLGKTELVYDLKKQPHGFICTHKSEKLALTHRALRKEMEAKFSSVLQKLGADVELG